MDLQSYPTPGQPFSKPKKRNRLKTYVSTEPLIDFCSQRRLTPTDFARLAGIGSNTPSGWISKGLMPAWVGVMVQLLSERDRTHKSPATFNILQIEREHIETVGALVKHLGGSITQINVEE